MLMLCRAMGSRTIVLETGARREKAKEFGADFVFDFLDGGVLEQIQRITGGKGADRCFDCAGNRASMELALHACRRGGTVGLVAIPKSPLMEIDLKTIVWDEKKLVGSRGNPNSPRPRPGDDERRADSGRADDYAPLPAGAVPGSAGFVHQPRRRRDQSSDHHELSLPGFGFAC